MTNRLFVGAVASGMALGSGLTLGVVAIMRILGVG